MLELIVGILFLFSFGNTLDFYYEIKTSNDPDGPQFEWLDATGGTNLNLGDDQNSGLRPILPLTFWFFGKEYDSIAICSNGWASFTASEVYMAPNTLPDPVFPDIVAPFATSVLDPGAGGAVYWDTSGTKTIIEWYNVKTVVSGGGYTFEIIIDSQDSSMIFQYLTPGDLPYDWQTFIVTAPSAIGIADFDTAFTFPQIQLRDSLAIRFRPVIQGVAENIVAETPKFNISVTNPNRIGDSKIKYTLPTKEQVEIKIFDLSGRCICDLFNEIQSAGTHSLIWDGKNNQGKISPAGTYFYIFKAGPYTARSKILILK